MGREPEQASANACIHLTEVSGSSLKELPRSSTCSHQPQAGKPESLNLVWTCLRSRRAEEHRSPVRRRDSELVFETGFLSVRGSYDCDTSDQALARLQVTRCLESSPLVISGQPHHKSMSVSTWFRQPTPSQPLYLLSSFDHLEPI